MAKDHEQARRELELGQQEEAAGASQAPPENAPGVHVCAQRSDNPSPETKDGGWACSWTSRVEGRHPDPRTMWGPADDVAQKKETHTQDKSQQRLWPRSQEGPRNPSAVVQAWIGKAPTDPFSGSAGEGGPSRTHPFQEMLLPSILEIS